MIHLIYVEQINENTFYNSLADEFYTWTRQHGKKYSYLSDQNNHHTLVAQAFIDPETSRIRAFNCKGYNLPLKVTEYCPNCTNESSHSFNSLDEVLNEKHKCSECDDDLVLCDTCIGCCTFCDNGDCYMLDTDYITNN